MVLLLSRLSDFPSYSLNMFFFITAHVYIGRIRLLCNEKTELRGIQDSPMSDCEANVSASGRNSYSEKLNCDVN